VQAKLSSVLTPHLNGDPCFLGISFADAAS
jgi:hypothetical protein